MLVVSRRRNESIMIADNVEVKIIDIRQNQVKVGITAPTEIPVHRREVYERIKAQQAAGTVEAAEPAEKLEDIEPKEDATF
jgi:carbon storage regulator